MKKNLPIIAIVGPPNAGKSTLLNKIAGGRLAVTSPVAGTTRDRQYAQTSFQGVDFVLVDTAGLDLSAKGELQTNIQKQIEVALTEADALILVVDGKQPASALDQKVLIKFRKLKKTKVLAVNKIDSPKKRETEAFKFLKLGVKPTFVISTVTGTGIGDMLEYLVSAITNFTAQALKEIGKEDTNNNKIKVAIVGKPNVGKSSLFNAILKQERAVVSQIPGTTRTSIDDEVMIDGVNYRFIDTAGLKRKAYRQLEPDLFSGFQTFKSIRRSDVCFLVIDAVENITSQDQKIAQEILQMQKGCVILANKIDLYRHTPPQSPPYKGGELGGLQDYISRHFPFLWMCPAFFVSATTDEGLDEAIKALKPIYDRRNKKIDNQTLSELLNKLIKKQPPKRLWDQKAPKVFALRQIDVNPPTFELIVNHPAAISQHFRHFLENSILKELDFWGTPIKLLLKRKMGS